MMLDTFQPVAEAIAEAFAETGGWGDYSLREIYDQYWIE